MYVKVVSCRFLEL
uniref:Uncharacterized protein n=1 Tax=Arundo donax TaxID=35708 RepID=A0A0A9BTN3_ARUDO